MLALVFWLAAGEAVARARWERPGWAFPAKLGRPASAPGRPSSWPRGRWSNIRIPLPYVGHAINLFLLFARRAGRRAQRDRDSAGARLESFSRSPRKHRRHAEEPESIWGLTEEVGRCRKPVAQSVHAAGGKTRQVWDNPIIWREIATWAYGRKVLAIRLAYLVLVGLAVGGPAWPASRRARLGMASAALGAGAAVRAQPGAGQRPGRHRA